VAAARLGFRPPGRLEEATRGERNGFFRSLGLIVFDEVAEAGGRWRDYGLDFFDYPMVPTS
jgi:hypothetical protein